MAQLKGMTCQELKSANEKLRGMLSHDIRIVNLSFKFLTIFQWLLLTSRQD